MNLIKLMYILLISSNYKYLTVSKKEWDKYKILIKILTRLNRNYKSCVIFRKKFKRYENFVVVGLKTNGYKVRRRTLGFAKEFVSNNINCKCLYCDAELTTDNATTDHIIPISQCGTNVQVNLIVCCFDCNNLRGDEEFYSFLKRRNDKYKDIDEPYI